MPRTTAAVSQPLSLPLSLLRRIERSRLPPLVVVGTDVTGLTLARAVRPHGVTVLGVDSERRTPTSYSSALSFIECSELYGPPFLEFLELLGGALPQRAVLFLSMDEHVKLVGTLGQYLKELYRFEYPTPAAVDLLMNKERFGRHAEVMGWPVPATSYCETAADIEGAIERLTFPVILKPQVKNLAFRTHSPAKSFRCESPAALRDTFGLVSQWEPEVVVQEWVPGGDDEIWFSLHYHDAELREIGSFEGRKLRQWVPECGSTSMAVGVAQSRVTELSRRILRECGCVGFGAVEYKRDPRTDEFRIMEPTVGRVNLQVGVAAANGSKYVARAYYHLIGRPYPDGEDRPRHDVKWVLGGSDFRSARFYMRRGDLTWKGYLSSLRGPKRWAVWAWTDPGIMRASARLWSRLPLRTARWILRRLRSA